MNDTAIVDLANVSLSRGEQEILNAVSWQVRRGEHWALLGANGSGKTSLLKLVSGYEWPTGGEVAVLGEGYGRCDLRELRKAIGWVSSAMLYPFPAHQTALEVAVSGFDASIGLYREMSPEEWADAAAALQHLGAGRLAGRAYRLLSQGEQQRVLIARAMVHSPSLLILDEPCAGLDPVTRESFLGDLDRLSRRPDAPTQILVTHHIEEIGPWISHVLVLKAGRVIARGEKAGVLRPEVLAAAFGGDCRVDRHDDRYFLRVLSTGDPSHAES